ncbi:MAG: OsmC family protein [Gammaproteobacteria bacterium]|nr:OsmC family protein [Gammaproteobacteria bacterium]
MKSSLKWINGVKFEATSGSGHSVIMDGAPEAGGENAGSRPMELILMGLSGCSTFDVVQVLKKSRADFDDVRVEVSAERAEETPAVFTKIHLEFIVTGKNLNEKLVRRAIKLSAEKYCSASIMLERGGVDITHSLTIVEAE